MADIPSTSGNAVTQNSFSDRSAGAVSDSSLQSDADSTDLTTGERLSRDTTTEDQLKTAQSPLDNLLSDATDLASDAYESLQTLDQEYALSQRGMGVLKTLGGLGEAFIGSVGIVAPEPATTVGGTIIFAHGTDVAWSGLQEMWYGKPIETLTDQAVTEGAMMLGADEATAKSLGDGTDIGLSLGSAGVGIYQILTRPLIPQLEPIIVQPQAKSIAATENSASSSAKAATYEGRGAESAGTLQARDVGTANIATLRNATNTEGKGFNTANLESKLANYLLNPMHPQNQYKAAWFDKALGFNQSNWEHLGGQLIFDEAKAIVTKATAYGTHYEQVITITGINERVIDVPFVFMKDNNNVVRLVTGVPAKK